MGQANECRYTEYILSCCTEVYSVERASALASRVDRCQRKELKVVLLIKAGALEGLER
jgi:hypothetical protein